jgi:hypothetical protein
MCLWFWKLNIQFVQLLMAFCIVLVLDLWALYVFWMLNFFWWITSKYFLFFPILCVLSLLCCFLWCTEDFRFDEIPFVNSSSFFLSYWSPTQKVVVYACVMMCFLCFLVVDLKLMSYNKIFDNPFWFDFVQD